MPPDAIIRSCAHFLCEEGKHEAITAPHFTSILLTGIGGSPGATGTGRPCNTDDLWRYPFWSIMRCLPLGRVLINAQIANAQIAAVYALTLRLRHGYAFLRLGCPRNKVRALITEGEP